MALGSFPDSTATDSFQRNIGVSGKDSFVHSFRSVSIVNFMGCWISYNVSLVEPSLIPLVPQEKLRVGHVAM